MDTFAQIAKSGIQGRLDQLIQPAPMPLTADRLTLEACDRAPGAVPEKMRTAQQLGAALETQRQWAATYLADYAPPMEAYRSVTKLRDFRCRNEAGEVTEVTIPHYAGPLGAARLVYETTFTLSALEGRRAFVVIRGADYRAAVFVNDQLVGTHEGFFATFEFDVTDCVHMGENRLTIRLDNDFVMMGSRNEASAEKIYGDKIYAATGPGYDDPALGWHHCPPGMGLLDTVEIQLRAPVYIQDVFSRTLDGEMEFWIEVGSCLYAPQPVSFDVSIYGQNRRETVVEHLRVVPSTGKQLGLGDTFTEVASRRDGTLNATLPLPCRKGRNRYKVKVDAGSMAWWSPETPWLYQIQIRLLDAAGQVIDTHAQQFGRRTFTQDMDSTPTGMFYLNGTPIRLRGANTMGFEQQDVMRGDFDQLIDDILLAKLCHMNFLRITQRPVQQQVYEYCDRLGLMVQTDLPLFGCLRRHQFCEAVRQAEEMERHIRSHPSCILISYINEPFPNANNAPQSNLDRSELECFFDVADLIVKLNNPDRVIKHVDGDYDPPSKTMPDNHCYPMWYNGHGIDIGLLHKGHWMYVKPDWYYGCGEFGCEGLEDWELMCQTYPKDWLLQPGEPDEAWSPKRIVNAQTADFYHFFYERPDSPRAWVQESQRFQAFATRMMTEAFRRDDRMVSFAIHLFIDAFPSGWMKTIMDCRRHPKPAFFAYRDALEPLLVSLRTDKACFFAGETAQAECWICNDTQLSGSRTLRYELLHGGKVIAEAAQPAAVGANTACCNSIVSFALPETDRREEVTLRAILLDGETVLSWNEQVYTVFPPCAAPGPVLVRRAENVTEADIAYAAQGGILWIDCPAEGFHTFDGSRVQVKLSGMSPFHFASRKTGHPWVDGFQSRDFSYWYSRETDSITPLADSTMVAEDFRPVLTSRNLDATGAWQEENVLCEKSVGRGHLVLSQISYSMMLDNPAGQLLLSQMTQTSALH